MKALYAILGLFLFFSGMYAIISGLGTGVNSAADSTFDFKIFHVKAPIKIIYGLASFAFIVGMIKVATVRNQEEEIKLLKHKVETLEKDRADLQNKLLFYNPDSRSFRFEISYEPSSIFDGQVLIHPSEASIWSGDSLRFIGIIGVSDFRTGPFGRQSIEISNGKRFYLQTRDSVLWGVNIFQTKFRIQGELFREKK